ncbi:hypothetical protein [Blastococcus sp. SYSU DS1024]
MTPDPSDRSSPRTDALRGIALLLVVVLGLAALFWDGGESDAAVEADPTVAPPSASASKSSAAARTTATRTRSQVRVPDLAGVRLDVAEDQLWGLERATGVDIDVPASHDLSPRGRSQWQDENWTVVTTRPAAGQPLTDGADLHLFVLRNAEWAWFQAHPAMPPVPVDVAPADLAAAGQLFDGMRELLEYRYAPGHEPEYASAPPSGIARPVDGLADDPSVEPAAEREERDALATASSYSTLTVGSLPATGTALRVGRLLTVTVREKPSEPASGGNDVSVNPGYSGGDDDVNVPGWLCPTRFC